MNSIPEPCDQLRTTYLHTRRMLLIPGSVPSRRSQRYHSRLQRQTAAETQCRAESEELPSVERSGWRQLDEHVFFRSLHCISVTDRGKNTPLIWLLWSWPSQQGTVYKLCTSRRCKPCWEIKDGSKHFLLRLTQTFANLPWFHKTKDLQMRLSYGGSYMYPSVIPDKTSGPSEASAETTMKLGHYKSKADCW